MSGYFDRLRASARARRSLLCVGLDPDPDRIEGGAAGALKFCAEVVRRTSDVAACYKPNSAFWEQYGPDGWKAMKELFEGIPDDVPILLDAKRADVGSTMRAYARAVFEALGADACTVHAYHGADSLQEFTRYRDAGVYVVARTSNPGAADLQQLQADGDPFYLAVARLAERVNEHGNVGLVVGATAPEDVRRMRVDSQLPFLLPGVGAQGGDLEESVRAAWNGDEASCLVNVSRGVLYADDPAAAAREYRDRINAVLNAVAN